MRLLRGSFALVLAVAACNEPTPAPPPPEVKRVDPKNNPIPVPGHSPEALSDPGEPASRSAEGTIDITIGDNVHHLDFLPPGKNAAIHVEETGVDRVTLSASEDRTGYPSLRISLENLRLDHVKLPATFGPAARHGGDDRVVLRIRYLLDESRWWETRPDDTKDGKNKVTLTSFDGDVLTGTLQTHLHPRRDDLGDPIDIEGEFEVQMRLNGVEPGKSVAPPKTDASKSDASKTDASKADASKAGG